MEYLDYYDIDKNYLGKESRDVVHAKGLWHKTIHCWLYDGEGNVYFQIRTDLKKLYTTASGHVGAGETLKQAFAREVKEEIGVDVDIKNAKYIMEIVWELDRQKADGTMWRDRALANIYATKIDSKKLMFTFDENEVLGLVKVNVDDALKILQTESGTMRATKICAGNKRQEITVGFEDFLINPGEIGIIKYGRILQVIRGLQ